jgi:hypothetical protein
VVLHEIDEVLGLGSSLPSKPFGTIYPRISIAMYAPNTRTFTTTDSRISGVSAFFSIDAQTAPAEFDQQNDGGDFGDWQSNPRRSGVTAKVRTPRDCRRKSGSERRVDALTSPAA